MEGYIPRIEIKSSEGIRFSKNLMETGALAQIEDAYSGNYLTALVCIVLWVTLLGDSPDSEKPPRVINSFFNKAVNDLKGVISQFSDLSTELMNSLRATPEGISIDFVEGMKRTPIFKEYLMFLDNRDPHVLQYILTFLRFGKKIRFVEDDLETGALRSWLEIEDGLGALELPGCTSNLRQCYIALFKEWGTDDFLPKHGSGAVAERGIRGVELKNRSFHIPKKIRYAYLSNRMETPDIDLFPTPDGSREYPEVGASPSRLMFVPKDYDSVRSICMESIPYQWAQQGVRRWLEHHIADSFLINHVNIRDQSGNRDLARTGSKCRDVDTIDLSSASDTVSWDLIKEISPAGVLKHLAATRSSTVLLPNGDNHELRKFAPMGSALCFPVQCTVFSAIIMMVSVARYLGVDWRDRDSLYPFNIGYLWRIIHRRPFENGRALRPFRVYGDDIILDSRITSDVIDALRLLGFKVNENKSFTGKSAYRESCGGHYFDGHDVTPLVNKIKLPKQRLDLASVAGLIDLANRASTYSYGNLYRAIVRLVLYSDISGVRREKAQSRNPILFTDRADDSFAFVCASPHNTHLKLREYKRDGGLHRSDHTHIAYQRDEVRSVALRPKQQHAHSFENYEYVLWWRNHSRGENLASDAKPSRVDPRGTGVAWRWTARA